MTMKIEQDHQRFRQIVKGQIKKELAKYITKSELIGKQGKNLVSIPIPFIEIPHFRYGHKQTGGVGQGKGEPGDPLAKGDEEQGIGKAGDLPGEHILEVELTIDELAAILGETLELPNIHPKGKKNITTIKYKYNTIRTTGPESLRHFKRTYKEALKRQIMTGAYFYERPRVTPVKEDKRYRSFSELPIPEASAVIFYIMDVSGSMGDEQKELVRIESFWIDTWLRSQYKNIEIRYLVHDAAAKEVDRDTFYHLRESGGTRISSAYELCYKIIDHYYPVSQWNIYAFQFSDGDNWGDDNKSCTNLLTQYLLPLLNMLGYGQVKSHFGSGDFIKLLEPLAEKHTNLLLSKIDSKEQIIDSIKTFLSKGL